MIDMFYLSRELTYTELQSAEEIVKNKAYDHKTDELMFNCKAIDNFKKYYKESEKIMGEEKMWSMYDVIVVDKDKLETLVDKSVIAKSVDHAKGLAGYYDRLEGKDYDDSKLIVKVAKITDVRPVKDDE